MNSITRECSPLEVEGVMRRLLGGMGFAGFSFDTSFRLRFTGETTGEQPAALDLILEAEWRIGPEDLWRKTVARLAPADAVQPEEPVQAFYLALLRWSPGSEVTNVLLSKESLELVTEGGTTISVSCTDEGSDFAWRLVEPSVPEPEARWSVACGDDGTLYLRTPA